MVFFVLRVIVSTYLDNNFHASSGSTIRRGDVADELFHLNDVNLCNRCG